jgi:ASTRA-associated protein 1
MSMHLFAAHPNTSMPKRPSDELRLLCAYENGSVTLRKRMRTDIQKSVEGIGWEIVWTSKLHVETGKINFIRVAK